MKLLNNASLSTVVLVIGVVGCCGLVTESFGQKTSVESFVELLNVEPIPRPSSVSDRLEAKVVEYVFDGIPTTRMDLVHPSVVFSNMVYPDWNLKPAGYAAQSIAFLHRTFQDTSFSITLFKKGSYIDPTDKDSLLGVAADLYQKYGESIAFEPWQNDEFNDPNTPGSLVPYLAKAIGFTVSRDGLVKVVRLYYFPIGSWTVEVAFEGKESSFDATYPSFDEYINRLIVTEQ